VVAVVQGDAIAGGNELALHCDLVVASTSARFGMSLAQIGLAPSWFLAKKLLEVAGPVAARKMLFLGDPLPASRLYDLGVISHLASPEALAATADEVIRRLTANAPLSLRAMKAVLVREMAFRDGISHADVDRLVAAAQLSDDAREGMAARLEKRQPQFKGR
jgi:enoyl-CoA hydratase/carnithine racemase